LLLLHLPDLVCHPNRTRQIPIHVDLEYVPLILEDGVTKVFDV
jgi:hypothetical protein